MDGFLATPVAELFELDLPLHHLLVLASGVVHVFASGAAEPDEFFGEFSLCHANVIKIYKLKCEVNFTITLSTPP